MSSYRDEMGAPVFVLPGWTMARQQPFEAEAADQSAPVDTRWLGPCRAASQLRRKGHAARALHEQTALPAFCTRFPVLHSPLAVHFSYPLQLLDTSLNSCNMPIQLPYGQRVLLLLALVLASLVLVYVISLTANAVPS